MINIRKYALALFLAVLVRPSKAQDASKSAFTLQEAIDYAIKHSPSALNAQLDENNALYKKREVTGIGLPQISGSIDLKDYLSLPTSLLPGAIFNQPGYIPVKFGTKYNATAGFSVSQLIFSADYIFGVRASSEFMSLSKIATDRTKADVVSQVSKAYYFVLIMRDRIRTVDANIVRLKKIYDDTKASNAAGLAEAIDVQRLEVQYNNLLSEKDKLVRLITLSESTLKFQMGMNISDPLTLSDSLRFNENEYQELNSSNVDITKRPDLLLLKAQQNLYEIDVKRLKWGYMPTLAAYGSYQYNAQRNTFNLLTFDQTNPLTTWYKISLIGATLNLTIFDGLQRHNKIQQAQVTAMKNRNMLRTIELGGQMEASSAAIAYNNAYSSLLIQKKNLELAQNVYEVANKKYLSGVGSNLEVVTAESSFKETQTNYYNALYDMLVAKIDYQKATGALTK